MNTKTKKLVESAIMIALATVLSLLGFKLMPYGGSVTYASMVPLVVIAYRHGTKWGLLTGAVYGLIQLLFGLSDLKGLTPVAYVGSILFDFIIAFGCIGLAGLFRGKLGSKAPLEMGVGALVACVARFIAHFISGFLFFGQYAEWFFGEAGNTAVLDKLSGNALAIYYSLVYNATFMIPETVITVVVCVILSAFINFRPANISVGRQ